MNLSRLIVLVAIVAGLGITMSRFTAGMMTVLHPVAVEAEADARGSAPERPVVVERTVEQPAPRKLSGRKVALDADPSGHFLTDVTINGRSVEVMVDTGATAVAINASTARRLGVYPRSVRIKVPITTANGVISAEVVKLSEIRLGVISVRNVEVLVAPDESLSMNLLGMSFLKKLSKFEMAGGQLVLTQ